MWLALDRKTGLYGLWVGMAVALTYCSVIGCMLCYRTDWDHETAKVAKRMAEEDRLQFQPIEYDARAFIDEDSV